MKENTKKDCFFSKEAFTLIELLVVVLIIGILAAVAVPQYQKAVMKSRYAKLKILAKALSDAEEVYYVANGKYTGDIKDLDVDLPGTATQISTDGAGDNNYSFEFGRCSVNGNAALKRVVCAVPDNSIIYGRNLQYQPSYPALAGKQRCGGGSTISATICQAEAGVSAPNDPLSGLHYYW